MPRKILDISLIEKNKSDLTFFNIDEDEGDETLKALKQTYVTTNYKEETILNLQSSLKNNSDETSKELKLESYKRYNNALDLCEKSYITSAIDMVEKALEINPKDIDILNLKGLLTLLKCDFTKAFESFYTGLCYGNNELSIKYVDLLSSEEYKTFLARYNHSIRFINEDLNHESIQILDNIIEEDPDLIEPYVILSLLYDKLGNINKREMYLDRLKEVDRDNSLFDKTENIDDENSQKEEKTNNIKQNNKNAKKKSGIPYFIIGFLVVGMGVYAVQSKNKIENLNSELSKKEEKLDEAGKELNEASQKLDETKKELDTKNTEGVKPEIVIASEETLYNNAIKLKASQNYEEAIKYFKQVVKYGKTKKNISESMYQVAILSEQTGNIEDAITYYKKYINTYEAKDQYYDDSYYLLGMLYYNQGQLQKAKDAFYGLRSEVSNSMYNNSKVSNILKQK
ncbi:MAG: tetratricopeptide repeat protein [Romboutsia sp.]